MCGCMDLTSKMENDNFLYGKGKDKVELSSVVAVYKCSMCGFTWLNWDALNKRDEAVSEYLRSR